MNKIWSELPPKSYSVTYNGQLIGIGVSPLWDQIPGAWNILSACLNDKLEALLTWGDRPENFPCYFGHVPYAVGMALQMASGHETWGQLADRTTPEEFFSVLFAHPSYENFLLPLIFPTMFKEMAEEKIAAYREHAPNVIKGDFGQGRRSN